jgi:hypothetical protein
MKQLRHTPLASATLAVMLLSATTAHAALVSRLDGQAVYDTDLNITWLANANLAETNTFGVSGINADGTMTWVTAQSWIGAMNTADYLGYNDWMLPTTLQPDASCYGAPNNYGCTGSQMGHLFYNELGGVAGSSISTTHNASYSLFNKVQADGYWSDAKVSSIPDFAWGFYMDTGSQRFASYSLSYLYAWVVRPGDVAPVPEPETLGLMLSGLALVGAAARRRKA